MSTILRDHHYQATCFFFFNSANDTSEAPAMIGEIAVDIELLDWEAFAGCSPDTLNAKGTHAFVVAIRDLHE